METALRQLSFRPFRRVGDKLVVTSYMGWRKIYTANYEGAIVKLLPFPEIKKGEILYARGKIDFWQQIEFEPLFWPIESAILWTHWSEAVALLQAGLPHPYSEGVPDDKVYGAFDCDGCPAFSHKTSSSIAEHYPDKIHLFEPLTAQIVYEYFEAMRDRLKKVQWVK